MLMSKICFWLQFLYFLAGLTLNFVATKGKFYRLALGPVRPEEVEKCDSTITQQKGHLYSPLYPKRYGQFSDCLYTIKRYSSDVCMVKLTMEFFDVIEADNCTQHYFLLQSGYTYHRLCGTFPPGTKKYVAFPEKSDTLIFKFKSTFLRAHGFSIDVLQLRNSCTNESERITGPEEAPCSRDIRGRWGRITSPGYPNNYGPGEHCIYTIYRSEPRACSVELDFLQFDLTPTTMCTSDYLHLPDGSRLCGTIGSLKKSLIFPPGMDHVTFMFSSDNNAGKGKGFNIQVNQFPGPCGARIQEPDTHQCDQVIRTSSGMFTSPGFPLSFGPNHHCAYILHRMDPSVCRLELQFLLFDLGKHNPPTCLQGAYFELPGHARICQAFVGKKIIDVSEFQDPVIFSFVSDRYSSGGGFEIKVTQIPHTCRGYEKGSPRIPDAIERCYQEISTEVGYFTASRSYVERDSQDTCEFIVKKAHPTVCILQLQLSFRRLPTLSCSRNYILLPNGDKLCIELSFTKEISFPRGSDRMRLLYHGYDGAEFTLMIHQVQNSCPVLSEPMFLNSSKSQWTWKSKPR